MFAASIGLVSAAAMRAGRWPGLIASALIAAFAALPYDANNLFWGGQSQMYALNFLAIGTLAIAAGERLGPLAWLGGAAAGSVSLVTMGSGFVAPGLAAGICAVRFIFEPARRRDLAVLALVFGAIAAAGLLAREDSRWHAFAYARTATKFWRSFLAYATWPLPPHWASVAVVWLPWLAVGIWTLARRAGSCLDWLAIGVGAWALVNVIGLAYARPDLTPPFDSKYNTALSLAAMASVLSSCALSARLRRRRWLLIAPVAASLAVAVGMTDYGVRGMAEARFYRGLKILHNAIVRPYLATGDRSLMVYFAPERSPYWNCAELAIRLDSPLLQPVLPSPLRKVLATRPGMHVPGLLEPGPLTLDARTLMKTSPLIFAIGLALIVLGLRRPAAPGAGVANTPKH
jgi:hypothetical protein